MGKAAALAWDGSATSGEARHVAEKVESNSQPEKHVGRAHRRTKQRYTRRTIELHPDIEELLDKLQDDLRLRSHTEVMQKAIQLLAVVLGDQESGRRKIFVERRDGKLQELLII